MQADVSPQPLSSSAAVTVAPLGSTRRRPRAVEPAYSDEVELASLVPLLPRIHQALRTIVQCVPIVDLRMFLSFHESRAGGRWDAESNEWLKWWECQHDRYRKSSEWITLVGTPLPHDEEPLQMALRHAAHVHREAVLGDTWTPTDGIALMEWAGGKFSCTKDLFRAAEELKIRLMHQIVLPPGERWFLAQSDRKERVLSHVGADAIDVSRPSLNTTMDHVGKSWTLTAATCGGEVKRKLTSLQKASLLSLHRIRDVIESPSSLLGEKMFNVTFVRLRDLHYVPGYTRLTNHLEDQQSISRFIDDSLLFCIEHIRNRHMTSLHPFSALLRRMDVDVACSFEALWDLLVMALKRYSIARVEMMWEIGKFSLPRGAKKPETVAVVERCLAAYGSSNSPNEIVRALLMSSDALKKIARDRKGTDVIADRFEADILEDAWTSIREGLEDTVDGEHSFQHCKSFVQRNGRTMSTNEVVMMVKKMK